MVIPQVLFYGNWTCFKLWKTLHLSSESLTGAAYLWTLWSREVINSLMGSFSLLMRYFVKSCLLCVNSSNMMAPGLFLVSVMSVESTASSSRPWKVAASPSNVYSCTVTWSETLQWFKWFKQYSLTCVYQHSSVSDRLWSFLSHCVLIYLNANTCRQLFYVEEFLFIQL